MPRRESAVVSAVLEFWREAGMERWFAKDPQFDRRFRQRFHDAHMAVAARSHDAWLGAPDGALALILLTDQFPRNAFRGTAHMYATDPLARHYARRAHALGYIDRIDPELRVFLCLPFSHSEDPADQDLAVRLNERIGGTSLSFALGHREIIGRFGRFPHRNRLLGRESTAEEEAFLAEGGFAG